jgi:hypothetical protein
MLCKRAGKILKHGGILINSIGTVLHTCFVDIATDILICGGTLENLIGNMEKDFT